MNENIKITDIDCINLLRESILIMLAELKRHKGTGNYVDTYAHTVKLLIQSLCELLKTKDHLSRTLNHESNNTPAN